jgi:hypothetical protein
MATKSKSGGQSVAPVDVDKYAAQWVIFGAVLPETLRVVNVSVPRFVMDCEALCKVLKKKAVGAALEAVEFDKAEQIAFMEGVAGLREAQVRWDLVRGRSKAAELAGLEEEGRALRRRLIKRCRWFLRADRKALEVLRAVEAGSGLPDLVQDLHVLSGLVTAHKAKLPASGGLDPVAAAARASALAGLLGEDAGSADDVEARSRAKLLRDQAFTWVYEQVQVLQLAAEVAFEDDAPTLERFTATYWASQARGARGEPVPVVDVDAPVE